MNKKIIITDISGADASQAAVQLVGKGYKDVSVLIEGIDRLLYSHEDIIRDPGFYKSPVSYHLINSKTFGKMVAEKKDFLILDIRSADEYANTHKDSWRNIGHIKNAVNIPAADLASRLQELGADKQKAVMLYSLGNGTELYETAEALQKAGFKNIYVIVGGLFNVRWTAGNVKAQGYLKDLVVDVPEINQ